MKVLVIGTDRTIFEERSPARERVEEYATLFDELHIVIFTPLQPGVKIEFSELPMSPLPRRPAGMSARVVTGFAPPGFTPTPDVVWGFTEEKTGTRLALYPTNSRNVFRRPFDAAAIGERIIRERGIDCVSVQDPSESGLAGWLLKRRTGLPLHIQVHTDIFAPAFRKNSWREFVRYVIARFVIRRGDRFRVVSERIRASLLVLGIPEARIRVLPIFVDAAAIAAAPPAPNIRDRFPEFQKIILMVARLVREKNIPLALEAFVMLLAEFSDAGLVIVGDGPEREDIGERIREWGLAKRIRMVGWQEDLLPYYRGADCYVLTSNFEGYGRSVVEAAAAGLPVVMTDVGVAGDLIRNGETGTVVPIGKSSALAQALGRVLRDPGAARAMAERAKREVLAQSPATRDEYLAHYRDSFQ